MKLPPLLDVCQSPFWKLPVYLSRLNFHRNLEIAVDSMKVRWPVVSIVHGDNNSEKSAEFGHMPSYSGRICRLTSALNGASERAKRGSPVSVFERVVRRHRPLASFE